MPMTYKLAHAASWDAENRSMRAAGRTRWNQDDWNAAAREFERLVPESEREGLTAGSEGQS